ncbi:MAG: transposase [Roseibacillus sp.]
MSNRPRRFRHYDEEFKRSAGQLCLKGEKTVAELAEELGVSTGSLYGWRSQFLDESEVRPVSSLLPASRMIRSMGSS